MQRAYAGPNSGSETDIESGVDQDVRKRFSEFQHATMWQYLSSLD